MAKKKNQDEEVIVDVQEVYSKTELFIEENKNPIVGVVLAIAILVGGYFAYTKLYLGPLQDEANEEMFMAEKYFNQDSMNLALYGFLEIIDNYAATKAGNLARYYAGISYLRIGQFEAAIAALEDFDKEDEVIGTIAVGAIGDAYMELGDLNKAAKNYEKAANRRENEFTSPIYLKKAAQTFEILGDYDKAVELYKRIKVDYTTSTEALDIDKYIARAEAFVN